MEEARPVQPRVYVPVVHHWFYQDETGSHSKWIPFSLVDSQTLENVFTSNSSKDSVISVEGTRYDVNISQRTRTPVYWEGTASTVRRSSWFQKGSSGHVPYEEDFSSKLEEQYKYTFQENSWPKTIVMENGESVTFHSPDITYVTPAGFKVPEWGNGQGQPRPKTLKRGVASFDIDKGESSKADHILFMVHGIGSICDIKGRTVEEAVDDFRASAYQLVRSHYKSSVENGKVHRIEILPINWHKKLHSTETGIDEQLKSITLQSIPRLRDFTNNTILDVLFYISPMYCEHIVMAVGNEMNRIIGLYRERNPGFEGDISLGGHSLGSLIVFDLLSNQRDDNTSTEEKGEVNGQCETKETLKRKMSRKISYKMGKVGTGHPEIQYPHLDFEPKTFFALGSPIGMFAIIRGVDTLGESFSLPTCPGFFNIFHPYDPIAYRIEPLILPEVSNLKPVLVPHHKGRKRMHIELKETVERVGADIKQRFFESMRSTWNAFFQTRDSQGTPDTPSKDEETTTPLVSRLGNLNGGRRIDYVLQEAPYELFNDYLFALQSHVCYWDSEDTILFMVKEIYSTGGIVADSQIPQQTMTVERTTSIGHLEDLHLLDTISDELDEAVG